MKLAQKNMQSKNPQFWPNQAKNSSNEMLILAGFGPFIKDVINQGEGGKKSQKNDDVFWHISGE